MSERLSNHGNQIANYILDGDCRLRDLDWMELVALEVANDLSYLRVIDRLVWDEEEQPRPMVVDEKAERRRLTKQEVFELFHKDIGM